MLVEWESGVVVGNGLFEVRFGGDVVPTNTKEEGGKGDEESETDGVVDFSLTDGFGSPELAFGVVPFPVFVVVDERTVLHVFYVSNKFL